MGDERIDIQGKVLLSASLEENKTWTQISRTFSDCALNHSCLFEVLVQRVVF
jgi:hypothetical protein